MPRLLPALLTTLLFVAPLEAPRAECPQEVPESEWSLLKPLARKALVLDVLRVEDVHVAVGERGHVLVSEDDGRTWTQKRTPTRTLLTGVWFHDRRLGWAVGHDAVILRTEDGGESWCRVHFAPELEFPLLDIWFADARNGFALGAYGYFLRTSDGGLTWTEEALEVSPAHGAAHDAEDDGSDDLAEDDFSGDDEAWDDDEWLDEGVAADLHLNRIVEGPGGSLFLMAESGTVFRSDDEGHSWVALDPPYDGSFFGGLAVSDGSLLVFGLRGNMFRSWDGGEQWREVRLPVDTSLFGGTRLDDGRIVVVGTAGVMLVSREGERFRLVQRPDRKAMVAAAPTRDGTVIVVGEPGVERLEARVLTAE